jgi:hypothetical protein
MRGKGYTPNIGAGELYGIKMVLKTFSGKF